MTIQSKQSQTEPFQTRRVSTTRRPVILLAGAMAMFLALAACGASEEASPTTDEAPESTEAELGSELDASGTTMAKDDASTTTTTSSSTTTTTQGTTTTEDLGEPLDFFPPIGTSFTVVGVRWDDDLNFRSGPGTSNSVLANVASIDNGHDIIGLGQAWQFEDSIWWKVSVNGTEAWASSRFLAAHGQVDDIFDEVAADLLILKSANLTELAERVADSRSDGEPATRMVIVGEPFAFEGSGGTITIDVLGFGDDALKGERLTITAALIMSADDEPVVEAVVLEGVKRVLLCSRGVSGGLCA